MPPSWLADYSFLLKMNSPQSSSSKLVMIVANQVKAVGPEDRRDGQAVPGQHYGLVHSYKVFCAVGGGHRWEMSDVRQNRTIVVSM